MTIQTIIDTAQAISKDRRPNVDVTRTLGGVVKYARSGPFLTTFEVTASYPTQAQHDAFVEQYVTNLIGPYEVMFSEFTVRTGGVYFDHNNNPSVRGSGQTGSTLNIDGLAPVVTDLLVAGDTVQIAGIPFTYLITQNVNTNNLGAKHTPVSYTHLTLPTICSV